MKDEVTAVKPQLHPSSFRLHPLAFIPDGRASDSGSGSAGGLTDDARVDDAARGVERQLDDRARRVEDAADGLPRGVGRVGALLRERRDAADGALADDRPGGVERALDDVARAVDDALDGLAERVDGRTQKPARLRDVVQGLADGSDRAVNDPARLERGVGDAAHRPDRVVHALQEAFEYLRVAVDGRQRAVDDGGDVVEPDL